MDAPLLLSLAQGFQSLGACIVQNLWVSPRALALQWAPERRAGLGPGHAWVFLLNPSPELWMLHESSAAFKALKSESKVALNRRWGLELKGARLVGVDGDPRERRLQMHFRRRALTGRVAGMDLTFQAIPGRAGLRLDGLDLNTIHIGLGALFARETPVPATDTIPFQRFRERLGDRWETALTGLVPDVLEGEGALWERHRDWSMARAEKLLLAPRQASIERNLRREGERLARHGAALAEDRARHERGLLIKEPAATLKAELWRIKGATGHAVLSDGTRMELPVGMSAEEAVQRWFSAAKKAERGLDRLETLEREHQRQCLELQVRMETADAVIPSPKLREKKTMQEKKPGTRESDKEKDFRRVDVEGFAILVGKGDTGNDTLTFKIGNPCDFWLHVASVPGSHVIIRNPDKVGEPPRNVLERAAELAAWHSKARAGGKVEVHWCRVADVSKPRGFPPGKVLLKTFKSVRVYPKL